MPKDKWGGCSYGSPSFGWSGRRKPGHGDHLLPPQSSQGGGLWSALCPTLVWLSGTKCSFSEEFHQLTLSPMGVLWLPLPRCDHSHWGHFICPIPTGLAMPTQATPILWHWGGPAMAGGRGRVKGVSLLPGNLVEKFWGRASPIQSNTTIHSLITPHPHWKEGSQTEEGPGFHPALKQLQGISQAKVQLEWELAHEVGGLTRKYKDWQIRLARTLEKWWAHMAEEADATFQEVFSQTTPTDSVKLLLCCISSTNPPHYINKVLATAAWQREDVPVTITTPELEGSQALAPTDSPVHKTRTLSLPVCPCGISPLLALPQLEAHLLDSLSAPCRKSGAALPVAHSVINATSKPMSMPKRLR